MREVKFRGKSLIELPDVPKGEWVFGKLVGGTKRPHIVGKVVESCEEYINFEYWIPVDPKTVGVLTGLKDKSFKEVFESDILWDAWRDIKFIVRWDDGGQFVFDNPKDKRGTDDYYELDENGMNPENMIVIGNIHDNPELLKGEQHV
ncbi:YopX family protein [Evansella tamaricis]|uniref:YopX family protein n=1 Tax=Evansella tamaricis TaxID=2069301 RepID=A0ABS6JBQ0_9BACI|nr:YopX family protein [Evansella tamaricis]MBU9711096.1 YopX family protein [Evansella tamaricis]